MTQEALKSFSEAIKIDKTVLEPYLNIHKVLIDQGRNIESLNFTKKLIKEFPNNFMVHFCHGLSLEKNNYLTEALESYEKTIILIRNI